MENNTLIQQIKRILKPIVSDGKIILYGSRSRGDYRPTSDVDLMILLPDKYSGSDYSELLLQISGALFNLELEWGMKVEISPTILRESVFLQRETAFTKNVLKDGIEL